jgi:hypothetical protein
MMVTSSGNAVLFDQHAHEVEVGLRGGREADLDLLHADLHQLLEEAQLLLGAHRLDQGLVAVAQVGAHPDRRLGDAAARPLAVDQRDGGEGAVFGGGIGQHGGSSWSVCCAVFTGFGGVAWAAGRATKR